MKSGLISAIIFIFTVCVNGQMGSRTPSTDTRDTLNARVPYVSSTGQGSITFASAFRWNRTGPTGGTWSENIIEDNIFRPVFSEVAVYRLRVFNRFGYMVFESSDLYKGWDGYLKNGSLAPQGVYIWKVEGKFTDGSPFNEAGDVTFIH